LSGRAAELRADIQTAAGVEFHVESTQLRAIPNAERPTPNTELESRQKIWRWLIVGALGVLVLETWWAGRASRQIAQQMELAT
jgi:hypothetical protein